MTIIIIIISQADFSDSVTGCWSEQVSRFHPLKTTSDVTDQRISATLLRKASFLLNQLLVCRSGSPDEFGINPNRSNNF